MTAKKQQQPQQPKLLADAEIMRAAVLVARSGTRFTIHQIKDGLVHYSRGRERGTRIQSLTLWLERMRDAQVIERRK